MHNRTPVAALLTAVPEAVAATAHVTGEAASALLAQWVAMLDVQGLLEERTLGNLDAGRTDAPATTHTNTQPATHT